ncbi:MAG: hypothetical protein QXX95_08185 [Nitrososphaerales archaeon]
MVIATIALIALSLLIPMALAQNNGKGDSKVKDLDKSERAQIFKAEVLVKGKKEEIKVLIQLRGAPRGEYNVIMVEGNSATILGRITIDGNSKKVKELFTVDAAAGEHEISIKIANDSITILQTKVFKVKVKEKVNGEE